MTKKHNKIKLERWNFIMTTKYCKMNRSLLGKICIFNECSPTRKTYLQTKNHPLHATTFDDWESQGATTIIMQFTTVEPDKLEGRSTST